MITFSVEQKSSFSVVHVNVGEVCEPADLAKMEVPAISGGQGVILSGRMPMWVCACLTHHFHATQWVATFDPRIGGGVVVESHLKGVSVGEIIPLEGK